MHSNVDDEVEDGAVVCTSLVAGLDYLNEADADADDWMLCEDDCDDAQAAANPGATEDSAELCSDDIDNDCDGDVDDVDSDCEGVGDDDDSAGGDDEDRGQCTPAGLTP